MIPKVCKRLAEVDFPIAAVSAHSAREKSIRHGHPSTLHLWWARRPLAACRAMLLALLLPDPCDQHCPAEFKEQAREFLTGFPAIALDKSDLSLRRGILGFIRDFADWDNAAKPRYLEVGRGLVKAAHGEEPPLVVDPFAGGGSIPLEALRLGCDAFASDLNPVACLILKVMLEDIPRHGPALADELRKVGAEIKKQAEKELAQYYPPHPDGATPIAYLWARTVRCESPNCGAEIPLVRSLWLRKKVTRPRALRYEVRRAAARLPHVRFEVFEPTNENDVQPGTVRQGHATCPACGRTLFVDRVRAQLARQTGGADVIFDARGRRIGGSRLLAIVTLSDTVAGRQYRIAGDRDYEAVWGAQKAVSRFANEKLPNGMTIIPSEPTPTDGTGGVGGGYRTRKYGIHSFGDFSSQRQRLAILTFVRSCRRLSESAPHLKRALGLVLSRCVDYWSSLCSWHLTGEKVNHTFGRQALPIIWDYCEVNPFSESSGNYDGAVDWVSKTAEMLPRISPGEVQLADAAKSPLPDDAASVWFTDPPYYDSVPYADLSDFFFVWLKRALSEEPLLRDPFDPENELTPKLRECVRDEQDHRDGRPKKSSRWYESAMNVSFGEGRRVLSDDGAASVVFAHKTTEGWEALLSGLITAGWTITASWPVATEMGARLRARESAALATSVHLICRPRREDAPLGEWAEVFRELPSRIGDWMERLSSEGVHGADLVFACVGPAMEIYSRYGRVEDAEGREIPLGGDPEASAPHERGFLAYVWEIVGRTALGQVLGTAEARARNGAAGALEEDARLTALFLWTIQSTSANGDEATAAADDEQAEEADDDDSGAGDGARKGLSLIYDVVRRFSQPLGIHLDTWEGRIIETKKGIVRLLPVNERAEQLLGEDGASGVASVIERSRGGQINFQFGFMETEKRASKPARDGGKGAKRSPLQKREGSGVRSDEAPAVAPGTTTLDRVHIAMLLQKSGKSNALRTMLKSETERGPDFLRLANALSALYPTNSEEKRLLDAMLLAVSR